MPDHIREEDAKLVVDILSMLLIEGDSCTYGKEERLEAVIEALANFRVIHIIDKE
jgi:hypothetical protein